MSVREHKAEKERHTKTPELLLFFLSSAKTTEEQGDIHTPLMCPLQTLQPMGFFMTSACPYPPAHIQSYGLGLEEDNLLCLMSFCNTERIFVSLNSIKSTSNADMMLNFF